MLDNVSLHAASGGKNFKSYLTSLSLFLTSSIRCWCADRHVSSRDCHFNDDNKLTVGVNDDRQIKSEKNWDRELFQHHSTQNTINTHLRPNSLPLKKVKLSFFKAYMEFMLRLSHHAEFHFVLNSDLHMTVFHFYWPTYALNCIIIIIIRGLEL